MGSICIPITVAVLDGMTHSEPKVSSNYHRIVYRFVPRSRTDLLPLPACIRDLVVWIANSTTRATRNNRQSAGVSVRSAGGGEAGEPDQPTGGARGSGIGAPAPRGGAFAAVRHGGGLSCPGPRGGPVPDAARAYGGE